MIKSIDSIDGHAQFDSNDKWGLVVCLV